MSGNTINDNAKASINATIKSIQLEPGKKFTANGRDYTVADTFAIGRLETVNLMEEELVMFSDRKTCHQVMREAMAMINDYKPGEAYVLLYNKLESDIKNAKLMHFALRVCTAYINFEGEDIGYLTEEQIKIKIDDWSREGLDIRPFIFFAMAVYKTLIADSKTGIQNILTEARSIQDALNMEMDTSISTNKSGSGKVE